VNKPSSEIRALISREFGRGVGRSALLRDTFYFVPSPDDLRTKVEVARKKMAEILGVESERLSEVYAESRWDCDNAATLGCILVKAFHEVQARGTDAGEYCIHIMSRADMDHTQAVCLTDDGFYCVEFITGVVWSVKELKPDVLLIG
jgi:hypothetical protein